MVQKKNVVKRVYLELAKLIESVGTNRFNQLRLQVMSLLREADETLAAGYIPWRKTSTFKRLYVLNEHAHTVFMHILENHTSQSSKLPPLLSELIREITMFIDEKTGEPNDPIRQQHLEELDENTHLLYLKIYAAYKTLHEPPSHVNETIQFSKPSLKTILGGAFDKNSIIFISALRFSLITIFAAVIAHLFELERSYWVPLSCVAVMSGYSIIATYHRAIQRGIGTLIGIIFASLILATQPSGYIIVLFIFLLTFMTELFIVKNYALAALFFTPNALLIAESTSEGSYTIGYFVSTRIIDVLIGIIIGLIGVWLMGRRSASSRLPHVITKTIRSQAQLLVALFSSQGANLKSEHSGEIKKMRTNVNNLRILYDTASGEIPVDHNLFDHYWSVMFSIEQLSYLLANSSKADRPIISDDILAQLLYAYEMMTLATHRNRSPDRIHIPDIEGFPSLRNELINLQKALQFS